MITLKIINKKEPLKAKFGIKFPDIVPSRLQEKTIEPTKEVQEVVYDKNYDGLGKVTVEAIPEEYIIPQGTLEIAGNGEVDVTNYKTANVGVYIPPKLQEKSVEIIENGEQTIVPDEGYEGLKSVEINTNVQPGFGNDYVENGLIAYFDGHDALDNSNRWNSRVGTDYWQPSYPNSSYNNSLIQGLQTNDTKLSDGSFTMINMKDYLYEDYTVELVGSCSVTTNFFTFDKNQTPEINIGRFVDADGGVFTPINVSNGEKYLEETIGGLFNKRCTMAINLKKFVPRGTYSGNTLIMYSVNGSEWKFWGICNVNNTSSYKTKKSVLFGYYSTAGGQPCGINCVRIYNRRLSDEELAHNYEIDKIKFGVGENQTTRVDFTNISKEIISVEVGGTQNEYSSWGLYDYIDVSEISRIEYGGVPAYKNTSNGLELYGIVFYDEGKNFVSGISPSNADRVTKIYGSKGEDIFISGAIDIPENVKYIRVAGATLFNTTQVPVVNCIKPL